MKDYERIRYMYLVDGISQRKIARSLGISRNTVAKYCEGKTYPGIRSDYNRANSVMTPKVVQFIRCACMRMNWNRIKSSTIPRNVFMTAC